MIIVQYLAILLQYYCTRPARPRHKHDDSAHGSDAANRRHARASARSAALHRAPFKALLEHLIAQHGKLRGPSSEASKSLGVLFGAARHARWPTLGARCTPHASVGIFSGDFEPYWGVLSSSGTPKIARSTTPKLSSAASTRPTTTLMSCRRPVAFWTGIFCIPGPRKATRSYFQCH